MDPKCVAAVAIATLMVVGVWAVTPAAGHSSTGTPPLTPVGWINISAVNQYGYSPADLENVPTHANITVTFTDRSPMEHTFTIIGKEGWVVPSDSSQDQIDALAFGHNPTALANVNVSGPGDVNRTNFMSPGPGWYEFVCTVSGHFALGMYGFVAFGMSLPSNLTPTNRTPLGGGLSFNTTEAIVVGALVLVAAGSYVALRRRRARQRQDQTEPEPPR
jgi:plastocyanin